VKGQSVLYVTERCVFRLRPEGLHLLEVAPGIDIERDVLAHMAFRPIIGEVTLMDPRIFRSKPMGLAAVLQDLQLTDRLSYDAGRDILFANFEAMVIRNADDIECVRRVFDALCTKVCRRVALIVNYDGLRLDESLADEYFEMVATLQDKHYSTTTRYTTSALMRMELGEALATRQAAAHVLRHTPRLLASSARDDRLARRTY
jgi:propionate CoA-transferase